MKTRIHFILISVFIISHLSCKTQKRTPAPSANANPAQSTAASGTLPVNNPVTPQTAASGEPLVRFVVSFYSRGEGIDFNSKEEFVHFLNAYPKKIAYEPIKWGREGEVEFCLALNELTSAEQVNFIKKTNEILSKSKLVHVNENSPCNHKGQGQPIDPNVITDPDKYRLVVSFYSIGEGIDSKNKENFDVFLKNRSQKIIFEQTPWGREGEVDYCFKLNELTSPEQTDFVKKAKEILGKSTLVRINENEKCVHKH